jgi:pimeloyl-ACP methyl ester carboxylesterase
MIEFVRTPESFFVNLKEFPYQPKYLLNLPYTNNARLAYIDEGTNTNGVALFLHGNPTWSYCYRKMIPIMIDAGFRTIAPDMIGFGRSDKPVQQLWHNFTRHYNILSSFINYLNIKNITLICHDWGGLFGLNIVPTMAERFKRIIVLNTMLCTGTTMPDVWYRWTKYNDTQYDLNPVQCLVESGCVLSETEKQGYLAPYPNAFYKAAFRQFPKFIPDKYNYPGADIGRSSKQFWQNKWQGESFVAVGAQDQILADTTKQLAQDVIRGCPDPMVIDDAGHFLFEWGDQILKSALRSFSF